MKRREFLKGVGSFLASLWCVPLLPVVAEEVVVDEENIEEDLELQPAENFWQDTPYFWDGISREIPKYGNACNDDCSGCSFGDCPYADYEWVKELKAKQSTPLTRSWDETDNKCESIEWQKP